MDRNILKDLKLAMSDLYKETFEMVGNIAEEYPDIFAYKMEDICDVYLDPKDGDFVTVCFMNKEEIEEDCNEETSLITNMKFPFSYYEDNDNWRKELDGAKEIIEKIKLGDENNE